MYINSIFVAVLSYSNYVSPFSYPYVPLKISCICPCTDVVDGTLPSLTVLIIIDCFQSFSIDFASYFSFVFDLFRVIYSVVSMHNSMRHGDYLTTRVNVSTTSSIFLMNFLR